MTMTTLSVFSDQLLGSCMTVTTLSVFRSAARGVYDNDNAFCVFGSAARGVCDNDIAFCVFGSAARGVYDNDNAFCVFRSAARGVCDNDNAFCVFRSATRGVVPGSFGARGVAGGPAAPPLQRDGAVAAGAGCGAGGWPGAAHVGFLLPLPGAGRLPARRTHSVPRSERQHGSKHYTNKYLSQKLLPEFLREKNSKVTNG